MKLRVLAVDPGDKKIGLAVSDEMGVIANPLKVILHHSRDKDAREIVSIAKEKKVDRIVIGCSYDENNEITDQGRKASRLADTIRTIGFIDLELWDEFESTKAAQTARREMSVKRSKRKGHLDALAATIILQSYLDSQKKAG